MTETPKSSENTNFIPGSWHQFTVWKVITQFDETRSWVFMDERGQRYLLPFDHFAHYGFKEKDKVLCRIDKVNCSGKVFIEPKNPYYEEGQSYSFTVAGREYRKNGTGDLVPVFILKDYFDQEFPTEVASEYFEDQEIAEITGTVIRIKSGKLILRHEFEPQKTRILDVGNVYSLTVLETDHFFEEVKYFLLQDEDGHKHLMKAARFTEKGFQVGDVLQCKVVRMRSEGRYVFEVID